MQSSSSSSSIPSDRKPCYFNRSASLLSHGIKLRSVKRSRLFVIVRRISSAWRNPSGWNSFWMGLVPTGQFQFQSNIFPRVSVTFQAVCGIGYSDIHLHLVTFSIRWVLIFISFRAYRFFCSIYTTFNLSRLL